MTNEEREKIIRDAVLKAQSKGVRIIYGRYGNEERKCPLTCVYSRAFIEPPPELETSRTWCDSFISGFDGWGPDTASDPEAYDIGAKLRKELIK